MIGTRWCRGRLLSWLTFSLVASSDTPAAFGLRTRRGVLGWMGIGVAVCSLLAMAGCGEDVGDQEESHPPMAITKSMRAVALDVRDIPLFESMPTPFSQVQDELPAFILRAQVHDERGQAMEASHPLDFEGHILAVYEQLGTVYDDLPEIDVHLDLQTLNRVRLSGPPHISSDQYRFRKLSSGRETPYRLHLAEIVQEVAAQVRPRRFVVGMAMNLYAETTTGQADWEHFLDFYTTVLRPTIKEASPQTLVSVGIHWDRFVAVSDSVVQARVDIGEVSNVRRTLAQVDQERFGVLLGAVLDDLDEIALEAHPAQSDARTIPMNLFWRLRPLIPHSKPLVFTRIWSAYATDQSDAASMVYLTRFRHMAGGLNVQQVAWDRLVDVLGGGDRCEQLLVNLEVPTDGRFCYSGFYNSRAREKSLWGAYLRTDIPPLP